MREVDRLDERTAVITGGARGIGLATARELGRLGANVAVLDLDQTTAHSLAEQISRDCSVRSIGLRCDVTQESSVETAFSRVEAALGGIDILVNNAGIMTPHLVPLEDMGADDFQRMIDVHVQGAVSCCRRVLKGMKERHFGRIINLTSVVGTLGLPHRSAYAVAKAGVVGLTRSIAVEAGRSGVTSNAVLPGWILTEVLRARLDEGLLDYDSYAQRTPVGRWGIPQEVGRVIALLATPALGFVNGAVVPVDGGYTVRGDADELDEPATYDLGELVRTFDEEDE